MINEINLRTNKNEYKPGDEIFGYVFIIWHMFSRYINYNCIEQFLLN